MIRVGEVELLGLSTEVHHWAFQEDFRSSGIGIETFTLQGRK